MQNYLYFSLEDQLGASNLRLLMISYSILKSMESFYDYITLQILLQEPDGPVIFGSLIYKIKLSK